MTAVMLITNIVLLAAVVLLIWSARLGNRSDALLAKAAELNENTVKLVEALEKARREARGGN